MRWLAVGLLLCGCGEGLAPGAELDGGAPPALEGTFVGMLEQEVTCPDMDGGPPTQAQASVRLHHASANSLSVGTDDCGDLVAILSESGDRATVSFKECPTVEDSGGTITRSYSSGTLSLTGTSVDATLRGGWLVIDSAHAHHGCSWASAGRLARQ